MATDLTIHIKNEPGSLAAAGEALGNAGINIEGVFAHSSPDGAVAHLLVEDEAAARSALQAAGISVGAAQPVLIVAPDDQPGVLGALCRDAADAGVNLTLTYLATDTRLVLAADDMAALRAALAA